MPIWVSSQLSQCHIQMYIHKYVYCTYVHMHACILHTCITLFLVIPGGQIMSSIKPIILLLLTHLFHDIMPTSHYPSSFAVSTRFKKNILCFQSPYLPYFSPPTLDFSRQNWMKTYTICVQHHLQSKKTLKMCSC